MAVHELEPDRRVAEVAREQVADEPARVGVALRDRGVEARLRVRERVVDRLRVEHLVVAQDLRVQLSTPQSQLLPVRGCVAITKRVRGTAR
jgi:hypothetical protein